MKPLTLQEAKDKLVNSLPFPYDSWEEMVKTCKYGEVDMLIKYHDEAAQLYGDSQYRAGRADESLRADNDRLKEIVEEQKGTIIKVAVEFATLKVESERLKDLINQNEREGIIYGSVNANAEINSLRKRCEDLEADQIILKSKAKQIEQECFDWRIKYENCKLLSQ